MSIILYSNDSSYYSMIARLVLAEKKVDYVMHKVDIHSKMEQFAPEYVKLQPNMTVPTLVTNNQILDNSHKIILFVNDKFPGENLCPEKDRQAIQQSLELHYAFSIEDLTMGNAMRKSPVAKFALKRGLNRATHQCHELMKQYPELAVACKNKLKLEQERQHLILSAENNYAQVYQQAIELCNKLEQTLITRQFIASDSYSLADVVWTVFLARLCMLKFEALIFSRKSLSAYWQRMIARESYNAANIWTKMPLRIILKIMLALLFKR